MSPNKSIQPHRNNTLYSILATPTPPTAKTIEDAIAHIYSHQRLRTSAKREQEKEGSNPTQKPKSKPPICIASHEQNKAQRTNATYPNPNYAKNTIRYATLVVKPSASAR